MLNEIDMREPAWSQIKQIVDDTLSNKFNYATEALRKIQLIMDHEDGEIITVVPETIEAGME